MQQYHDNEWGIPTHDDDLLFEYLCLEGAQAGLSWHSILSRRERYREVFDGFHIDTLANSTPNVDALMADSGIIRNRAKILSVYANARAARSLRQTFGSLNSYLWHFVGGATVVNRPNAHDDIPPFTETSTQMSRALREQNFNFVGPTICYAFMQATGMVDDHLADCFRTVPPR